MRYCPRCKQEFRKGERCPKCNAKLLQPAYPDESTKVKKRYYGVFALTTLIIVLLLFSVKFDFSINEKYYEPVIIQFNSTKMVGEGVSYRELNHTITDQSYIFFFESLDHESGTLTMEFECLDEDMQVIGKRKASSELRPNEVAKIEIKEACTGMAYYRYITRGDKQTEVAVTSEIESVVEKTRRVEVRGNIIDYISLRVTGRI